MKITTIAAISSLIFASSAHAADDAEMQAGSLFNIYQSMCMKYLNNMDDLRSKLKDIPKLPPEKASGFLQGMPGSAWPVPDKYGLFVLVLHESKNLCLVYGRRANADIVERKFVEIFNQAPAPLISSRIKDERIETKGNGPVHTFSYSWATPKAQRKMLFTLSTATSPDAQLQATLSAATTND